MVRGEVAVLKVVSPAIDGPNVALVVRFEHLGEERFARWLGDSDWREPAALQQLFESVDTLYAETGVGPARWQVGDAHGRVALGLSHHRVHDSRHFYAIRAIRAGTPYGARRAAARACGHRDGGEGLRPVCPAT
ncbi:MAG TPA: hypothetical protein VL308_04600 [Gemmatimonadaceae bacterium]|jgi:integrase|nr:hypothetical protein [Gemmatimonadaceae bacterium]